jgi:hypothetical protein
MKKLTLFMLSCTLAGVAMAQGYWSPHTDQRTITTDKAVTRQSFPQQFRLFDLNMEPLRRTLFSIAGNNVSTSTTISLPNADGSIEQFRVYEASNFEPSLQARFPEIRAFSGKGINDPSALLKLSISPQGIQTMVSRAGQSR